MKNVAAIAALLLAVAIGALVLGCAKNDDGLTTEQRNTQDRFTQIMERSNGNWENLTDDERKFMVDLANGNEQAAKTMFTMRAMRQQRPSPGNTGPMSR